MGSKVVFHIFMLNAIRSGGALSPEKSCLSDIMCYLSRFSGAAVRRVMTYITLEVLSEVTQGCLRRRLWRSVCMQERAWKIQFAGDRQLG